MDMPPLAGKIAALSLGAVPVSYALNHVSTLSQCVRGCGGRGWGCGGGRREDFARGEPGSQQALRPLAPSGMGAEWELGQNPQPEVPFRPSRSLCAGDRGAPGMFEA